MVGAVINLECDDSSGSNRERYLTAATYLSSRAFPSSILSPTPSLQWTSSSAPVLLPGVDLFDHSRQSRVSWVVSRLAEGGDQGSAAGDAYTDGRSPGELCIDLVHHPVANRGQELFNNYGAKPNSELILAYGFSLPQNMDDSIVLKIGGGSGKRWEVGRNARGVEGVWEEILGLVTEKGESERTFEDYLEASEVLVDMTQAMLDRLPDVNRHADMRPEVALMLKNLVEGMCA
jgi:hypothetical protein